MMTLIDYFIGYFVDILFFVFFVKNFVGQYCSYIKKNSYFCMLFV